jgi:Hydrolytic ATP binding site of dynein motor region
VQVLSVVAQQLLTIQNALKAGQPRFNFEGREMRLIPRQGAGHCGPKSRQPFDCKNNFTAVHMCGERFQGMLLWNVAKRSI